MTQGSALCALASSVSSPCLVSSRWIAEPCIVGALRFLIPYIIERGVEGIDQQCVESMHPAQRKQNLQRLQRELKHLREEPVPGVHAAPLPSNMLEWHFCIEGPAGSPYQGGYYHGIIRFPQEYPFKPPSIRMLTPSGRFEPNQRICLSMSDFHPETWNCMWSVSSILQGVVSFMLDSAPAIGPSNPCQPERAAQRPSLARLGLLDRYCIAADAACTCREVLNPNAKP